MSSYGSDASSSFRYTCQKCGNWVPFGSTHVCTNWQPVPDPTFGLAALAATLAQLATEMRNLVAAFERALAFYVESQRQEEG